MASLETLQRRIDDLEDRLRELERAKRRSPSRSRSPSPRRRRYQSRSPVRRRPPPHRRYHPSCRVHVTNISHSSEPFESRMSAIFGQYGKVVDIQYGANQLWANVTYETKQDADNCLYSYVNRDGYMQCYAYDREVNRMPAI